MSVTIGGATLVSDTASANEYGEYHFIEGSTEAEYYERSAPRADGVVEVTAGKRKRVHRLQVVWMTTAEATLRTAVEAYRNSTYYTLVVSDAGMTSRTYTYCRLADIQWGRRIGAYRAGSAAMAIECTLTFVQVKV